MSIDVVVFGVVFVAALGSALAMLFARSPVHTALFLVVAQVALALAFLLEGAFFVAAIQIIVYAGAIMVLFLFVIMLLGAERTYVERDAIAWQRPLAVVLGLLLLAEAAFVVFTRGVTAAPRAGTTEIGAPRAIAEALFTTYLLPLEITWVLLLVALVGAVVLTIKSRAGESW